MPVRLVSYSTPAIDAEDIKDIGDLIAYCARVSNPSNQHNTATADKLIKYLIKHKHWSPFEMASVCVEIETTRDIVRQILRHRSFSFQEFSQRYADPTVATAFTFKEARLQDTKNRQNSIETDDSDLQAAWDHMQGLVLETSKLAYKWAIEQGIAKEVARAVLPEGLTGSRLYMNGTIRSFIHYIEVRTDPSTQKEHREIALECARVIAEVFPMILDNVANDSSNPVRP